MNVMKNVQNKYVSISQECITGFNLRDPGYISPLPLPDLWSIATGARYQTQDATTLLAGCRSVYLGLGGSSGSAIVTDSSVDSIVMTNHDATSIEPIILVGGYVSVQFLATNLSSTIMSAIIGEGWKSDTSGGVYDGPRFNTFNGAVLLIDPIRNTITRLPFNENSVTFLPNGSPLLQVALPTVPTAFSALRIAVDWDNSPGGAYPTRPLFSATGISYFIKFNVDASIRIPMGSLTASTPLWKPNNLLFCGVLGPDGLFHNSAPLSATLNGHPLSQTGMRATMMAITPTDTSVAGSSNHPSYWYEAQAYPDGIQCYNQDFIAMRTSDAASYSPLLEPRTGAALLTPGFIGPPNLVTLPV